MERSVTDLTVEGKLGWKSFTTLGILYVLTAFFSIYFWYYASLCVPVPQWVSTFGSGLIVASFLIGVSAWVIAGIIAHDTFQSRAWIGAAFLVTSFFLSLVWATIFVAGGLCGA